jgi:hypothetical protein
MSIDLTEGQVITQRLMLYATCRYQEFAGIMARLASSFKKQRRPFKKYQRDYENDTFGEIANEAIWFVSPMIRFQPFARSNRELRQRLPL